MFQLKAPEKYPSGSSEERKSKRRAKLYSAQPIDPDSTYNIRYYVENFRKNVLNGMSHLSTSPLCG